MTDIPATADIVFKYILGAPESTDILRPFLNAVQRDSGLAQIASLDITNPVNLRGYVNDKMSITDVHTRDAPGNQFNVDVQIRRQTQSGRRTSLSSGCTFSRTPGRRTKR